MKATITRRPIPVAPPVTTAMRPSTENRFEASNAVLEAPGPLMVEESLEEDLAVPKEEKKLEAEEVFLVVWLRATKLPVLIPRLLAFLEL